MSDENPLTNKSADELTNEDLAEIFSPEFARHESWAAKERPKVDRVVGIFLEIADRMDGVRVTKHGQAVNNDGEHRANFSVKIAGTPYDAEDADASDVTVFDGHTARKGPESFGTEDSDR